MNRADIGLRNSDRDMMRGPFGIFFGRLGISDILLEFRLMLNKPNLVFKDGGVSIGVSLISPTYLCFWSDVRFLMVCLSFGFHVLYKVRYEVYRVFAVCEALSECLMD